MKKTLLYSLFVLVGCIALSVIFFVIRQKIANAEIERETQAVPATISDLKTTTKLEILPLYDEARAEARLVSGHGVSYLIRTDSATILMDVGNNPDESAPLPSMQNMRALGISWKEIDAVVITHPHPDHTGGLQAYQEQSIALGDTADDLSNMPIYVPVPVTYFGRTLVPSLEPALVSPDIATTGALPFQEVFPLSLSKPKEYEQALVIHVAGEGLVLITGCGHPTLERLVGRAEALYGQPVVGVLGGLHYGNLRAEELQSHIQFLTPRQPKLIALSPHDSSPEALEAFRSAFPDAYRAVKVGEAIQFP